MSNLMTSDLIRTTRQLVQGNARSPVNELDAEKLAASDQAVLVYPLTGVQPGMTVEIGWVLYVIVDVDVTARTLTLLEDIPGTAVTAAAGTRVTMRPRYPVRRIIEELNADLMDLSAHGIYKLRSILATDGVVTLPEDAVVILDVWSNEATTRRLVPAAWRISDSPTGPVLIGANDIDYAVFGCTLGELSYTTDMDLDDVGLVSTAEDLPPLGAAMRLLAGLEAQRNLIDTQGDTRRAGEVPAGSITQALRNLAAIRQQRLTAEAQRFQQRYGIKLHLAV